MGKPKRTRTSRPKPVEHVLDELWRARSATDGSTYEMADIDQPIDDAAAWANTQFHAAEVPQAGYKRQPRDVLRAAADVAIRKHM